MPDRPPLNDMGASFAEDEDGEGEGEGEVTKLRISLVLSPSYHHVDRDERESLLLPADPIAVPSSIRKRGLSAVVNHLLDRRVPKEEKDDDDDDDDHRLPAIPFDFLLNDKLLRLPLDSVVRKEGLSTEVALVLHYFPARPPPRLIEGDDERRALPDWITAMDYHRRVGGGGTLFTGGADGIVRAFSSFGTRGGTRTTSSSRCSASAHAGQIQCIAVSSRPPGGGGRRGGGRGRDDGPPRGILGRACQFR
jgi:ribosome biogenesis protein YTM1